jgi:ATP-dependent protease ClpP protease subunit
VNTSFRFWGRADPRGRTKPAILAEMPQPDAADGVATLRLYDPIDSWGDVWGISAKEFAESLDQIPDAKEIRLHINSPGGEVFEAVSIMNLLRAHPARVVGQVDGIAASAASLIAASADELIMGRNTTLMIHDAWGVCVGNAADMQQLAGVLDALSDNSASVYAEKAGGAVADWRGLMVAETWYSADEAVAAGLADRVDRPVTDPEAAQERFDLAGMFRHTGRESAPPPPAPSEGQAVPAKSDAFARRHAANRHRQVAARHKLPL